MIHNVLTVDIGNSRAKYGVFERGDDQVRPVAFSAVELRKQRDVAACIAEWAEDYEIESCVAAGSNPPVLDRLIDDWPAQLPVATSIRSTQAIPVRLAVDEPDAVGLDRVLNALAATKLCPGKNIIVVDSGTATTIDLVSAEGDFCGGTIFPGLRLSAYALHDYTARLPMIDMDAQQSAVPQLPGKNTEEAMRAGLYWGQLGAIREITDRMCKGPHERPILILTGGGSRLLWSHLPHARCVEALALHGLVLLAQ
ncbi:MAG: type III pantothenate kinase [Fuerstiella sp.]|nr:type III pantothenate kinase [Fuerstiella sp.]